MINILRFIKNISLNGRYFVNFIKWKIDGESIEDKVPLLFPDGLISINSKSRSWISNFIMKRNAFLFDYQEELISKYSLKDGDTFLGRDGNYVLIRDGEMTIKTDKLNVETNDVDITVANAITINGISLTFSGNKVSIEGNEIAVVGGTTNAPATITGSGQ
jgi:hypothetical protein